MKLDTDKIYNRMKTLGWTQDRLAFEMKMTRQGVSYYLRGLKHSPRLKSIEKLANALNLDPKDLIT